jgi:hypothetical protein
MSEIHDALVQIGSYAADLRLLRPDDRGRYHHSRSFAENTAMAVDTALRQWLALGMIRLAEPMPEIESMTGNEWQAVL